MTKLEQANYYIENLQIADFFAFLKSNAKPNEMLIRLENTFILGKTDVDFYEQLKTLTNVLLSEGFSSDTVEKEHTPTSQNLDKINIQNSKNIVTSVTIGNIGGNFTIGDNGV